MEGQTEDRAPPSLSLWLNADFFKRIVHRLANLPAANTAVHNGANVMRGVTCLRTCYQKHREDDEGCTHSLLLLFCTHWPLSGRLSQDNQRFTRRKTEHPKRLFQNEMFF